MTDRDCRHGSLRRSCEVCGVEAEREIAVQQRDRLLAAALRLREARGDPRGRHQAIQALTEVAEEVEKEKAGG